MNNIKTVSEPKRIPKSHTVSLGTATVSEVDHLKSELMILRSKMIPMLHVVNRLLKMPECSKCGKR